MLPLTIRSDHGVDSLEVFTKIQGGASGFLSNRVSKTSCLVVKEVRVMGGRQAFQESLHTGRQAIVNFVARGP